VQRFATSDPTFAILETLPVFFDGQHSLRIHQAFRERTEVFSSERLLRRFSTILGVMGSSGRPFPLE
jgi:hypothetical protein